MEELAAAPATALQHEPGSLTLASGWPPASPQRRKGGRNPGTRAGRDSAAARSTAVKCRRILRQMSPEPPSSTPESAIEPHKPAPALNQSASHARAVQRRLTYPCGLRRMHTRQAQRCRSAGLARRCPRPHRGYAADPARRTPPLELGSGTEARSGRVGQIAHGPHRSEPAAAQNQIEHPRVSVRRDRRWRISGQLPDRLPARCPRAAARRRG